MEGGKVIGSGTYGCIFKPSLPCKGSQTRVPDTVSKLMKITDADDEMKEINNVLQRIKNIPDNKLFYIISGVKKCSLGKIEPSDLEDFNKKCYAMERQKINEEQMKNPNIIDKLSLLQLPDGGKDITHYFGSRIKSFKPSLFVNVNNALVKLLEFGIAPLKDVGVLHQDIKGNNIVYSEEKDLARLIDWGLATLFEKDNVPQNVRGWPVMFNQPFTNLVFHKKIQQFYNTIVNSNPVIVKKIATYKGDNLVDELITDIQQKLTDGIFSHPDSIINTIGSEGHLYYLFDVIKRAASLESNPNHPIKKTSRRYSSIKDYLFNIITRHMACAFLYFSIKPNNTIGSFNEKKFFYEVYKTNCDVFGFLSTYVDIIMNNKMPLELRRKTYETVLKPFYFESTFAHNPYNVSNIVNVCLDLNNEYIEKDEKDKKINTHNFFKLEDERKDDIMEIFTWRLGKRCPNGSRRDKKTNKCIKFKINKKTVKHVKTVKPVKTVKNVKTVKTVKDSKRSSDIFSWPKTKRCPRGSRRDKKTQKCVNIKI